MIDPNAPVGSIEPGQTLPRRGWRLWVAGGAGLLVASVVWLGMVTPSSPLRTTEQQRAESPALLGSAAGRASVSHDWAAIDHDVAELLVTARQRQGLVLRRRIAALVATLRNRVDREFVPWYLSFGRRKLEELGAYNLYARDCLIEWLTGEHQQSAQISMISTFEDEFSRQVVRPDGLRQHLEQIGQEMADDYARHVAVGLREIQDGAGISFADWQTHLAGMPSLSFTGADGRRRSLTMDAFAAPHPVWLDLGSGIGTAAAARFDHLPRIVDLTTLVDGKGRSIFSAGENAGLYFGSYLVYWLVLIGLIRSGLIPFSLFGVLLGWLLWETVAWGSWIGLEYLDFEQTRANLAPIIDVRVDAWLAQLQALIADDGPSGPLKVLYQLEYPPAR